MTFTEHLLHCKSVFQLIFTSEGLNLKSGFKKMVPSQEIGNNLNLNLDSLKNHMHQRNLYLLPNYMVRFTGPFSYPTVKARPPGNRATPILH